MANTQSSWVNTLLMRISWSVLILITLGGCFPVFTGSKIRNFQADEAWLVDKKTTKQDLINHLGQPDSKKTLNGIRIWIYNGTSGLVSIAGNTLTDYYLDLYFNENSNVVHCRKYLSRRNGSSSTGNEYQLKDNMIEDTCTKIHMQ